MNAVEIPIPRGKQYFTTTKDGNQLEASKIRKLDSGEYQFVFPRHDDEPLILTAENVPESLDA